MQRYLTPVNLLSAVINMEAPGQTGQGGDKCMQVIAGTTVLDGFLWFYLKDILHFSEIARHDNFVKSCFTSKPKFTYVV